MKLISILTLLTALLRILPYPLNAQIVKPSADKLTDLDQQIYSFMKENNVPGCLTAVASRGDIRHLKTYGLADVEMSVTVRDSTVFEIGSISKQFVSAAIMLLVEEGKLTLEDPIHTYLPHLPGEWTGVTVYQLLTHTSGIPDYEEICTYDVYQSRFTPEEIIRFAHSRPMDFEPGKGWYYSNTGYFLASMIVERVEGQPLGQVLRSRIFAPLGMNQTRLADPECIIPHRAEGYWVNKAGELINRHPTETSSTLGAGGLLSSVHDLIKWDAALYGEKILTSESKKIMWQEAILPGGDSTGYALGWGVRDYKGLTYRGHGGQVAGFVARFSRFPDQEAAIIVFMNRYRVSSRQVSDYVLEAYLFPEIPNSE